MGRHLRWITLGGLLLLGAVMGCHKNAVQTKVPPDPLVTTKKPVEGRPRTHAPEDDAMPEPPAPPPNLDVSPSLPKGPPPPEMTYPSLLDVRGAPDRGR
jgi:hypothetical protein